MISHMRVQNKSLKGFDKYNHGVMMHEKSIESNYSWAIEEVKGKEFLQIVIEFEDW